MLSDHVGVCPCLLRCLPASRRPRPRPRSPRHALDAPRRTAGAAQHGGHVPAERQDPTGRRLAAAGAGLLGPARLGRAPFRGRGPRVSRGPVFPPFSVPNAAGPRGPPGGADRSHLGHGPGVGGCGGPRRARTRARRRPRSVADPAGSTGPGPTAPSRRILQFRSQLCRGRRDAPFCACPAYIQQSAVR